MNIIIPEIEDEITPAAFERWLKTSQHESKFVYYVGHLAIDREEVRFLPEYGQFAKIIHEPANTLAEMAMTAYVQGKASLVQQRLPSGQGYAYIAIKRKRRQK